MDDPTVINANRIDHLRSNLLTKAENLIGNINLEPEDDDDHSANVGTAETVYYLLQSFVDLR